MAPVRIVVLAALSTRACRMDAWKIPPCTPPPRGRNRSLFVGVPFALRCGERRQMIIYAAVLPTAPEGTHTGLNIPPTHPLTTACSWMRKIRDVIGYRRLHVLLEREGWGANAKKVYRLYREEGLSMRAKRPRRRKAAQVRQLRPPATERDERWSMDFMADQLGDGRKLRVLTIVDHYTRESLAMEVGQSMGSAEVIAVLDRLGRLRRRPRTISVDNGPEFASKALDAWAYRKGVTLDFSRPGKPTDNAVVEVTCPGKAEPV